MSDILFLALASVPRGSAKAIFGPGAVVLRDDFRHEGN